MYTYALMVFLLKHYCFRKQQIWHRVKPLNWPFPTPFPFPQHLPARCLSPLQRRSHLAGLGCFWCFPSHLLLFPFSCTSAGSDFALHRHRGCPQRNRLFILGAAQPPLGSLPAAGIFFCQEKGVITQWQQMPSGISQPSLSCQLHLLQDKLGPRGDLHEWLLAWHFFPPQNLYTSISISSLLTAVIGVHRHLTALPYPDFSRLTLPMLAHISPGLHVQEHPRLSGTPKSITLHPLPRMGASWSSPPQPAACSKAGVENLATKTPALSKAKSSPWSEKSSYICKEHHKSKL